VFPHLEARVGVGRGIPHFKGQTKLVNGSVFERYNFLLKLHVFHIFHILLDATESTKIIQPRKKKGEIHSFEHLENY
jgi:hypothetical protein